MIITIIRKVSVFAADRKASKRGTRATLDLINEVEPPEVKPISQHWSLTPLQVELVEVPKVLGDLLESLLGAVFLDSGHDLAQVWRVFHRLCPGLDSILENPPCTNYKR